MAWSRAITVEDRMPAPRKNRRFARRTIPVDLSPLKKRRCAAVEEEDAAAAILPGVDVGEGRCREVEVAHIAVEDRMPAPRKTRRFARRTIPVDLSPLKKRTCAVVEEEDTAAAALPGADDDGEGEVAQITVVDRMPAPLGKKRRFARRTIPVDLSPLKKKRCAVVEVENAASAVAALPGADDDGEGRSWEEEEVVRGVANAYQILNKIGKGSYGVVYEARERETGDTVALKKMRLDAAAMAEIGIFMSLPVHPCIVGLMGVVVPASGGRGGPFPDVYLVMEHMDSDLLGVIRAAEAESFGEAEAKCLMHQLLRGVAFLHANGVLHRDLKPSNLLLNRAGDLKVCDFGLSRRCVGGTAKQQPYTSLVVTRWYRAPELLLMDSEGYSAAVDMWSVGCIMAEILARTPLFPGRTELDQLHQIFGVLGVPDEATWPAFASLCSKMNMCFTTCDGGRQPCGGSKLREKLPRSSVSKAGHDLLARLLAYDPSRRLTAEAALNHPWFREAPAPTRLRLLLA